MRFSTAPRILALVVLPLTSVACGSDAVSPEPQPVATVLEKVSGDDQQAAAGAALTADLVVRVRDQNGQTLAGAPVSWQVTGGGGSLDAATTATDGHGIARTRWTLGIAAGDNGARASLGSITPAAFSALGVAGPAATVTVSPDTATLIAGVDTVRLEAEVRDENGNVIADAAIVWSSADELMATVDADGLVQALAEGEVAITAVIGNAVGEAIVHVLPPPLDILVNGGFDSDASGWQWSNVDGLGGWRSSGGNPDGYFILNSNGSCPVDPTIVQVLEGLVVGGRYLIAGQYIPIYPGFGSPAAFSFGVAIDDEVLEEWQRGPIDVWTAFSVEFNATATTHILSISAERNCDDSSYGIDNIAVDLVP